VNYYDTAELGGRVIKDINVKAQDKTAEIIKGVLDIAGTVVGMATGGGFGAVPTDAAKKPLHCKSSVLKALKDNGDLVAYIAKLDNEIEIIDKKLENVGHGKLGVIQKTIAKLLKSKQAKTKLKAEMGARIANNINNESLQLRVSSLLKPDWNGNDFNSKFKLSVGDIALSQWLSGISPMARFSAMNQGELSEQLTAEVRIYFGGQPIRKVCITPTRPGAACVENREVSGLIIREPKDGDLFVCKNTCEESDMKRLMSIAETREFTAKAGEKTPGYHGRVGIPQAGRPVIISLVNNPFQDNGIELARDSEGRITKFAYQTNATLAAATQSVAQSTKQISAIGTQIAGRDIARKQAELQRLTLKADLIQAQNRLESLGGK
jgi:hypothetical protein